MKGHEDRQERTIFRKSRVFMTEDIRLHSFSDRMKPQAKEKLLGIS